MRRRRTEVDCASCVSPDSNNFVPHDTVLLKIYTQELEIGAIKLFSQKLNPAYNLAKLKLIAQKFKDSRF